MFKKIKIKLTPTSKEEPEIYFDPEVFKLIGEQSLGIEEQLLKKIALALVPYNYRNLPYFVSRIIRAENGLYKVLILDAKPGVDNKIIGRVDILKISLSSGIEIKDNPRPEERRAAEEIDMRKLDIKLTETASLPTFFNLDLELNKNNKHVLDGYLKDFDKEKEKQVENFLSGKSCNPYHAEPDPPGFKPIDEQYYSFNKAQQVFESLKPLANLADNVKDIEESFSDFLQKFSAYLNEIGKSNNQLLDYALTLSKELDLDALSLAINNKVTTIKDLIDNVNADFALKYVNYVNTQEKINYIKRCLAWGLHFAAGIYFNGLQKDTIDDAKGRQQKLESFNKHFKSLVQIHEDGTISDINLVYDNIANQSLDDIAKSLNKLLAYECNTTTGWSSDKQIELVRGINKVATIVTGLNLKHPPFEAWEKSFLGMGKAGFKWEKSVAADEASLAKQSSFVENALNSDPKFQELKELDLADEANQLHSLQTNFADFQTRVSYQKRLLALQEESANITQKMDELYTAENGQNGLLPLANQISKKFAEITALSDEPINLFINNKPIKSNAINLPTYIDALVHNIQSAAEKIAPVAANISKIAEVNSTAPIRHLGLLEQRVIVLKKTYEEAAANKRELEKIAHDINLSHLAAVQKDKVKQLEQFKSQLNDVVREIGAQYRLSRTSKFAENPEMKQLLNNYRESKQVIDNLCKSYLEKKFVEEEDFLTQLQAAKQTLSQHFNNLKVCYKEINELITLLKAKTVTKQAPPPSEAKNASPEENSGLPKRPVPIRRRPDIAPSPIRSNNASGGGGNDPDRDEVISIAMPKPEEEPKKSFFKRHWGKMLVGGLSFSLLAVAGVFTGGAIPIVAGLLGGGTLAAVSTTCAAAAAGGTLGIATGALAGAIAGDPPKEGGIRGFFKRNWKKILIGAGVGLLATGVAAASVATFGTPVLVLGAISAATAASASAFGVTMSSALAGIVGCSIITAGSTILGAVLGGLAGSISEGKHFQKQAKAAPKPPTADHSQNSTPTEDDDEDRTSHHDLGLFFTNKPSTPPNTPKEGVNSKHVTFSSAEINEALLESQHKQQNPSRVDEPLDLAKTMIEIEQLQAQLEEEIDKNKLTDVYTINDDAKDASKNIINFPTPTSPKGSLTRYGLHNPATQSAKPYNSVTAAAEDNSTYLKV